MNTRTIRYFEQKAHCPACGHEIPLDAQQAARSKGGLVNIARHGANAVAARGRMGGRPPSGPAAVASKLFRPDSSGQINTRGGKSVRQTREAAERHGLPISQEPRP